MDDPTAHRAAAVAAVAALDEPTRRRLYEHVVRQAAPVSRDEAAAALQVPRATVAFHLDKLVDERLLDVSYERRTGRTGPGSGRPAKLYQRSGRQVAVSVPERHYELAGHLLAAALDEAEQAGQAPQAILQRRAHQAGRELGEAAWTGDGGRPDRHTVLLVLAEHGFEPRVDDGQVLLGNCPFHTLAQAHPQLVCGMNLSLLDGLLAGIGDTGMSARLDPAPGQCCVRLEPAP